MRLLTFNTLALLGLLHTFSVFGHVGIATTVPDHDAVIDRAPTLIRFVFPAEVTLTNVRLRPVDINLVSTSEEITVRLPRNRVGQSTAFGMEIDLPIPLLEAGIYQVVFQALSIEGHVMADDFVFTISTE